MSTAPTPKGPSEGLAPLPGPRISTDAPIEAFGGGRADRTIDVSGMQRAMVDLYQREHANATEVAINDADNQLQGLSTKLLYDPDQGALNKMGKDAFSTPEKVQEGWQKGVSDIAASLGTPEQQELFQHRAQARWQSVNAEVQRHVGEQKKVYEAQTTQDFIKNRQDDALHAVTPQGLDEPKVDQSIAEQQAVIADHGRRNGWSDEMIKAETAKQVSTTYSHVINSLLDGEQDIAAKTFYDKHQDQLQGAEALQVGKAVKEGSSRGESQQQFDRIMSKPDIDEPAAVKAARDIDDPRVRDLTEQRVRQEFTERRQAATAAREQNLQNVADFIDQTGGKKDPPPSMWSGLTGAERVEVAKWRQQKIDGVKPTTNWTYFYDQMQLASSDAGREQFLHEPLLAHRSELADPQFEKLTDLQASLRKGEDKSDDLAGYRTSTGIVHDALTAAGINPNAKAGSDDATAVALFHSEVDAQIEQFKQDKERPAGPKDVQDIVDKLMLKSTIPGSGFNFLGHTFNQRRGSLFEQQVTKLNEIPAAELLQIKAALRAYNRPTTEANIISTYQLGHMKPQAKP